MDPLSITASAIAVLQISGTIINLCYDYRSRIKNAAKEASRIVNELNSLRSVIDSLFVLLEDESKRKSAQHSALAKLAQSDGPLTRCITELTALQKKLELKEGWRATKAAILWPLKESDVNKVLHNIESMKSTVQLALAADQSKATLAIQDSIAYLNQQVSTSISRERRESIFRWLSAANPFSSHATARKKCQPMTGLWFIEGIQFERWSHTSNSFFWISGIPGCGKTILCSSIIDVLSTRSQTTPGAALAYFYLDFNDNKGSKVETLLRSIIAQLFTQKAETSNILDELFDRNQDGASQPTQKELFIAFSCMVREFSTVYVVIDALDECSEQNDMLQMLRDIQQWRVENLHILVTSRQLPEIENYLSDLATDGLSLHGTDLDRDISLYIRERLKEDQTLARWPSEIQEQIWITLSQEARGMFRWAVCQLETLRKCFTIGEVKRQLKTLPSTLEETYDQILLRIEESHRQSALKILKWLAFAAMPVTIEVVAETLAVDLSMEPCYNPDLKPFDPQDILIICSSLVTRVAVSLDDMLETLGTSNAPYLWVYGDFGSEDYEHDAIKLAHLSVKDYLCSDRIRSSKARHFAVDASLAHTFIAQTCLVYLLQPAFASGYCDENGILARNREWPLFHYAVHFWPFHVTISGDVLDDITWHLLLRFFRTKNAANGGNFAAWAVALTPDIALKNIHYTQPLYYAASFGITSLIRKLLDTNPEIDIDAPGGRFECSPLQVATFRHHQTAVKMLLEAGADPMSLNVRGESCLYWAVVQGHVEAEDLLKSYGATLTSRDIRLLNRFREAFPMREFIVTQDS